MPRSSSRSRSRSTELVSPVAIALCVLLLAAGSFQIGRRRALARAGGDASALHSLPGYYGWYAALWCAAPGLLAWLGGLSVARGESGASGLAALALALAVSVAGALRALRAIRPAFAARVAVERATRLGLLAAAAFAVLVTAGIVLSLLFESVRFFRSVPPSEFLFGLQWSPQMALRADQVGSSGAFGAVPVFAGTLLVTAIAMSVSVPVGLLAAIHLAFYASARVRAFVKPALEILAGIPTVVYGFFA